MSSFCISRGKGNQAFLRHIQATARRGANQTGRSHQRSTRREHRHSSQRSYLNSHTCSRCKSSHIAGRDGQAIVRVGRARRDPCRQAPHRSRHIDGAVDRYPGCPHPIVQTVRRRGSKDRLADIVDFDREREADIVPHQLNARMIVQMADAASRAGYRIVGGQDLVDLHRHSVDQMRFERPGSPVNRMPSQAS